MNTLHVRNRKAAATFAVVNHDWEMFLFVPVPAPYTQHHWNSKALTSISYLLGGEDVSDVTPDISVCKQGSLRHFLEFKSWLCFAFSTAML